MKIKLARHLGFCFGVKRAVDMAEDLLWRKEKGVFCLGPLIHNPQMVNKLSSSGLKVIERLDGIKNGTLLIRSHGESPRLIERARKKGLSIVDATCPIVKRLHNIASSLEKKGYRVLIVADRDHPEIRALSAVVRNLAVVNTKKDIRRFKIKNKRIGLLAQTTQSKEIYDYIFSQAAQEEPAELCAFDTICRDSARRQREAMDLARKVDAIIVLGGHNSANTGRLAAICKRRCSRTYHIETARGLKLSWFSQDETIGIISGASTPNWVIDGVIKKLKTKGERD